MNTIEKTIEEMQKDIRKLKLKAFEPDESSAKLFREYFSWEDGDAKKNFAAVYEKHLEIFNEWLEIYCEEYCCTKEDALEGIIDGVFPSEAE